MIDKQLLKSGAGADRQRHDPRYNVEDAEYEEVYPEPRRWQPKRIETELKSQPLGLCDFVNHHWMKDEPPNTRGFCVVWFWMSTVGGSIGIFLTILIGLRSLAESTVG